jgi:hypothetical protein
MKPFTSKETPQQIETRLEAERQAALRSSALLAVEAAMGEASAIAERLKSAGAMAAYYAVNRLWWELDKENQRLTGDTANDQAQAQPPPATPERNQKEQ